MAVILAASFGIGGEDRQPFQAFYRAKDSTRACSAIIDRRYRNLNAARFALDRCKMGLPNRRTNFAFPYC
jgi:hypothetical protein